MQCSQVYRQAWDGGSIFAISLYVFTVCALRVIVFSKEETAMSSIPITKPILRTLCKHKPSQCFRPARLAGQLSAQAR